MSKYLPNGAPNPNLGRPLLAGQFDPVNRSFTDYNTLMNDVLPPESLAQLNPRVEGPEGSQSYFEDSISGLSSVADLVSEGFEVEATMDITQNFLGSQDPLDVPANPDGPGRHHLFRAGMEVVPDHDVRLLDEIWVRVS